jgi:hypothetical protein
MGLQNRCHMSFLSKQKPRQAPGKYTTRNLRRSEPLQGYTIPPCITVTATKGKTQRLGADKVSGLPYGLEVQNT